MCPYRSSPSDRASRKRHHSGPAGGSPHITLTSPGRHSRFALEATMAHPGYRKAAWGAAYDIVVNAMEEGMLSPEDDEIEPANEMKSRLDAAENVEDIEVLFKRRG